MSHLLDIADLVQLPAEAPHFLHFYIISKLLKAPPRGCSSGFAGVWSAESDTAS